MREKRTILICPQCDKQGFVGPYYRADSIDCLNCAACGWTGDRTTVRQLVFRQEKVARIQIGWDTIDRIAYLFYGPATGPPLYEFKLQDEYHNSYMVTGEVESRYKKDADEFRRRGVPGDLPNSVVLNILCQDGWLEPGEYWVCW